MPRIPRNCYYACPHGCASTTDAFKFRRIEDWTTHLKQVHRVSWNCDSTECSAEHESFRSHNDHVRRKPEHHPKMHRLSEKAIELGFTAEGRARRLESEQRQRDRKEWGERAGRAAAVAAAIAAAAGPPTRANTGVGKARSRQRRVFFDEDKMEEELEQTKARNKQHTLARSEASKDNCWEIDSSDSEVIVVDHHVKREKTSGSRPPQLELSVTHESDASAPNSKRALEERKIELEMEKAWISFEKKKLELEAEESRRSRGSGLRKRSWNLWNGDFSERKSEGRILRVVEIRRSDCSLTLSRFCIRMAPLGMKLVKKEEGIV